jgi:hypothetical protein
LSEFADLELGLYLRDEKTFSIEGRLTQPGSDVDTLFGLDKPILMTYDPLDFENLILVPEDYGKKLSEIFFKDPGMVALWATARTAAQSAGAPLRLRLLISASAVELNSLYWETMRDPNDGSPLFTGEKVLFSRYLSAADLRPVRLRAKGDLKALVFVAAPQGLKEYKLADVDRAGETERAKQSLGDLSITVFPAKDGEHATLNSLIGCLRDGYDILYYAGHGTLTSAGEPVLWLENDQGGVERVLAAQLAERLNELTNQPRLVVMASCQSAGNGAGNALQAIGPRVARAGIPAVIAMQGNVSMDSVKKFMPVFFQELDRDGQIDRALAVARGSIRDAHDFWMPVLFMRLRSGRVWYVPGLGEDGEFDKWPALLGAINRGKCVPILGPGLYEPMIGSWREMAASLADKFNFPLSSYQRDILPAVAQFILVNQDFDTLFDTVGGMMRKAIQARFAADLPDPLKTPSADLLKLFSAGGSKMRLADEKEQHKFLASLPLPIYITTNYDNLLFDALKEAGKDPQMVICPWNEMIEGMDNTFYADPAYEPSVEKPLVYHLFGHLSLPESMVLTEDNFFEFMAGFAARRERQPQVIPPKVLSVLADSPLMLLGFHLDDWGFRTLFTTVLEKLQGVRSQRYSHVGIQLDPDETRNLDARRAHKYLEKYFQNSKVTIYWGKSEDFVRQLAQQLKAASGD